MNKKYSTENSKNDKINKVKNTKEDSKPNFKVSMFFVLLIMNIFVATNVMYYLPVCFVLHYFYNDKIKNI